MYYVCFLGTLLAVIAILHGVPFETVLFAILSVVSVFLIVLVLFGLINIIFRGPGS